MWKVIFLLNFKFFGWAPSHVLYFHYGIWKITIDLVILQLYEHRSGITSWKTIIIWIFQNNFFIGKWILTAQQIASSSRINGIQFSVRKTELSGKFQINLDYFNGNALLVGLIVPDVCVSQLSIFLYTYRDNKVEMRNAFYSFSKNNP